MLRSRSRNGLARLLRGTDQAMLAAFWLAWPRPIAPYRAASEPMTIAEVLPLRPSGLAELVADDRELAQRSVEQAVAEHRVVLDEEAQDRRRDQQQREDRDERVVGDDRREIGPLVVEVLVDDRDREPDDRELALEGIDATDAGLLVAHGR